jgi:hypothetical protein
MKRLVPLLLVGLLASPAFAGTATGSLEVTIQAPFAEVCTPGAPTIACNAPAGTVVAAITTTGGDGNTATFTATGGDTTDFAVSGSNVVVGPNGIAAADCGKTNNLTITATQP